MASKVLCVAEKPSIAKAVAQHLSGGSYETARTVQRYLGDQLTLASGLSQAINTSRTTSLTTPLVHHGATAK